MIGWGAWDKKWGEVWQMRLSGLAVKTASNGTSSEAPGCNSSETSLHGPGWSLFKWQAPITEMIGKTQSFFRISTWNFVRVFFYCNAFCGKFQIFIGRDIKIKYFGRLFPHFWKSQHLRYLLQFDSVTQSPLLAKKSVPSLNCIADGDSPKLILSKIRRAWRHFRPNYHDLGDRGDDGERGMRNLVAISAFLAIERRRKWEGGVSPHHSVCGIKPLRGKHENTI